MELSFNQMAENKGKCEDISENTIVFNGKRFYSYEVRYIDIVDFPPAYAHPHDQYILHSASNPPYTVHVRPDVCWGYTGVHCRQGNINKKSADFLLFCVLSQLTHSAKITTVRPQISPHKTTRFSYYPIPLHVSRRIYKEHNQKQEQKNLMTSLITMLLFLKVGI